MHYASVTSTALSEDYARRIKSLRGVRELTQGQLADLIGVSYATVNRWENEQSRPNQLAWRRIIELESEATHRIAEQPAAYDAPAHPPSMDFAADPAAVAAVAEAHRLAYGHLFNPAFATETSLIDPEAIPNGLPYEAICDLSGESAGAASSPRCGSWRRASPGSSRIGPTQRFWAAR
jgi:DNA-binding XRE family transcriptional regulator